MVIRRKFTGLHNFREINKSFNLKATQQWSKAKEIKKLK